MAKKEDKFPKKGKGDEPEPDLGEASADNDIGEDDGDDGLIEAEGPDVETSLSDADLAFLDKGSDDLAAERLADLQRLQAEYVNYRNRVERDREAGKQITIAETAKAFLPMLDDFDRAETHGDLENEAMALIAQKFRMTVEKLGVTKIGAKDEPFDHNLHEAIVQIPTPGVTKMTVADVIEVGYQLGSRLLRPAKVAVAVPADD